MSTPVLSVDALSQKVANNLGSVQVVIVSTDHLGFLTRDYLGDLIHYQLDTTRLSCQPQVIYLESPEMLPEIDGVLRTARSRGKPVFLVISEKNWNEVKKASAFLRDVSADAVYLA